MSETYLSRPVFDFPTQWDRTPEGQFQYELNALQLGQAAPHYAPTARQTVTGHRLKILLEDATAIAQFEAFVDAAQGRLNGFWLAAPPAAGQILEVKPEATGGTKEFWIADAQWRETSPAGTYLAFTCPGELAQYAPIESITRDAGREHVVLATALAAPLTPAWEAARLLYARFAADDVTLDYASEGVATAQLSVIELPEEYAAIETGQRPVFLYELSVTGLGTWRYTNLNENITSASEEFASWPIAHEGHEQSLDGGEHTLRLQTVFDAASPVARFFPYPTPAPLSVKVWETTYSAPDSRTLRFTGFAQRAEWNGAQATLHCATVIATLGATFPRFFIQNRCNYCLFSTPCSGADGPQKADYKVTATVAAAGARNVTLTGLTPSAPFGGTGRYPRDYFTFGYLEHVAHGDATGTQLDAIRTIESNLPELEDGTIYLTLTAPVEAARFQAGDTVYLYPGCDGTRETCATKFYNFTRWGGHNLALSNLSLAAVEAPSATANKK